MSSDYASSLSRSPASDARDAWDRAKREATSTRWQALGTHYIPVFLSQRQWAAQQRSPCPQPGGPGVRKRSASPAQLAGQWTRVGLARLGSAETAGRVAIPGTDPCAEGLVDIVRKCACRQSPLVNTWGTAKKGGWNGSHIFLMSFFSPPSADTPTEDQRFFKGS